MSTITTLRNVLATAALLAASTADAKPRHIVITDFDGPRELADQAADAVRAVLVDYDLVAKKRWDSARANAERTNAGPASWAKAAKTAGVDAVIEGWVQAEGGRRSLMTIIVRDASDGHALDQLTVKVGTKGLSASSERELREGLEDRLSWITSLSTGPDPIPVVERKRIGVKQDKPQHAQTSDDDADDTEQAPADDEQRPRKKKHKKVVVEDAAPAADDDQDDGETVEVTAKPKAKAETVATAAPAERQPCLDIFGDCSVDPAVRIGEKPIHKPIPTPRFRFDGGGYFGSRTLHFQADLIENITQYDGVSSKGLSVGGTVYPFPLKKLDGQLSGIGFSLSMYHSAGSVVGIDTDDTTGDYSLNQNGFMAAIHWRQPLTGIVNIDGEVGYSQDNYIIQDPPEGYEVPDTAYRALHTGAHLDLNITDFATVGFGFRYYLVTDSGDLTSTEFYGPGKTNGLSLDTNFVVPLPKNLFVKGALEYKRYKTSFSGGGLITDDEDVFDGTDSTINGSVNLGIQF